MRRQAPLTDDRGVALTEVLVATVIVSIGLSVLGMTTPLSSYGVHEGHALSAATFLAEQKLEEIRNATWATAAAGPGRPAGLAAEIAGEIDCLGTGAASPPTSTTCTRSRPTTCVSGSICTTYPDERTTQIPGYSGFSRIVRVWDCSEARPEVAAGCAGILHADLRLVRVSVSYAPMAAGAGIGHPAEKTATVEVIVAKRR